MNDPPEELKLEKKNHQINFIHRTSQMKDQKFKIIKSTLPEENKIVRIYRLLKKIIVSIERKHSIATEENQT